MVKFTECLVCCDVIFYFSPLRELHWRNKLCTTFWSMTKMNRDSKFNFQFLNSFSSLLSTVEDSCFCKSEELIRYPNFTVMTDNTVSSHLSDTDSSTLLVNQQTWACTTRLDGDQLNLTPHHQHPETKWGTLIHSVRICPSWLSF